MWDRPRRSPAASSTRSTSSRQAHPMPSPLRPSALAVIISCAAALAGSGCDNTITSSETLPPLEMASLDSNAGSWRMIVLSGPTQFTVAAPAAETSAAYMAELAAIRTAQANLTAAQRSSIVYWAGGGVLRWNQIVRELVARFNLPPAPRPDGTYPVPDPENPFADPQFPFANPPYAARAYSYVAVAQYEALKTAWYWKYRFHRRSPARIDSGIRALMPVGDLPAYPSEDAGLSLGKAVAATIIARAGADGMKNAVGNAALWQALADSAVARGEIPWISQESPPRPPMLPNFGLLQAWLMTSAEVTTERPPAPPSTSSAQMRQELSEVRQTVDHLTRDQLAIAYKWNDGAGTYTPPGHWNDIAAEYVRDARMSEVRAARAFALLNMAMHDAAVGCWGVKYTYFNPRPVQLDPGITTVIGLPNFPAYPSGHSTFSAAAAMVLSYLFPQAAPDFDAMKDEASISRLYGGIHDRRHRALGRASGAGVSGIRAEVAGP